MGEPAGTPRLVLVVANSITGDSRVQKAAIAAARDGWEVTLVGRSPTGRAQHSTLGPVTVLRVPVTDDYRRWVTHRRGHRWRRTLTQIGLPDVKALTAYQAAHRAWDLRRQTALAQRGEGWRQRPGRAWLKARTLLHKLRGKAWRWEERRRPGAGPRRPALTGDWRLDWPALVDDDLAFVPALIRLRPDVIHANDITMIGTVAQAVAALRLRGHRVAWLYDAHEYVAGVQWRVPAQNSAFPALEREFIQRADAVVTVSPEIAERLQADYRLPALPTVVRNTPIREAVGRHGKRPDVRSTAGLAPDVPLLVYSGWISAERGLATAVAALPQLPGVHLAIVAGTGSAELTALLQAADETGVRERIHVLPYVAQYDVPDYLSGADVGIICSQRTLNYELSLPTKLSEYLHAGLALVVSDVAALSDFVRTHECGLVFHADDVDSFAAAAAQALHRRAELAGRITPQLREELSWERQSANLVAVYRAIAPRVPAAPRPEVAWTAPERPAILSAPQPADAAAAGATRHWRPLGTTAVKLGLGPANYAGQAGMFALALTDAFPDVSAEVFMYRAATRSAFPADLHLDAALVRNPELQAAQVTRIVGRYTHLLVDAFRPVFGYLNGEDISADLPALRRAGITVALLAHGGEVRHPDRHRERYSFSHFHDVPDEETHQRLLTLVERNHRVAAESGLPVYVTTPDLLEDVPWARWAPLVVDVDAWTCDRPVMQRQRPVVLHAPSVRWTKGTERILPTLTDLHDRGVIELRLAEDLAWGYMREAVRDADIVIDQLTTGAYGTLACEAMAAGRPVIATISDFVRDVVGDELPIVDSTAQTLGDVLGQLLDDPAETAKIGLRSVDYVRAYHSGAWTARVLADFVH